jgi:hypothetical protein
MILNLKYTDVLSEQGCKSYFAKGLKYEQNKGRFECNILVGISADLPC